MADYKRNRKGNAVSVALHAETSLIHLKNSWKIGRFSWRPPWSPRMTRSSPRPPTASSLPGTRARRAFTDLRRRGPEQAGLHFDPSGQTDEVPAILERIKRGEGIHHYETVRQRKDGQLIHVSVSISPIRDKAGQIIGASTIARDVTAEVEARKQAEEKLASASQYARSLIESSLDPLVTISADGKITDVNEATIKVTGVAREQLIGTDFPTISRSRRKPGRVTSRCLPRASLPTIR